MESGITFSHPNAALDLRPMLPAEHPHPPEMFIISNGDLIAFHLIFLPFVNLIPRIISHRHVTRFEGHRVRISGAHLAEEETRLVEGETRNFALSAKYRRSVVQYIQLKMKSAPRGKLPQSCSLVSQRGCEAYFKSSLKHWREIQKLINPSTTIVLLPDDTSTNDLQATTSTVQYSNKEETLFSDNNKAVFFIEFLPLSSVSLVLQAPSKGYLVCTVCENGAAKYNTWLRLRGPKTKAPEDLIPRHNFECRSKTASSCWLVMSWTLEEAAQGGKRVFWELAKTTAVTSLSSSCVSPLKANPTRQPILGAWSVANQIDYTLSFESNFSTSFGDFPCYANEFRYRKFKEHVLDSLSSHRSYSWRRALSFSLSADLGIDRMENLVYVSEVGVESSSSAIDLYLNPMESPVWCAFLGALLIGCTTFATLSNFEPRKRNGTASWSWRRWALRFGQMFRYLGELFVDQCYSELPVRHRSTTVVCMVLPWLLATLIATNGFKSFFKARFLLPYSYKLGNQTRWQDFSNYSLYVIDNPSLECDCAHNGRNIQFSPIEEASVMKHSKSPAWKCLQFRQQGMPVRIRMSLTEKNKPLIGSNTDMSKEMYESMLEIMTGGNRFNKLRMAAIHKYADLMLAYRAMHTAQRICRHCLGLFVGPKYQETITKHKNLVRWLFPNGSPSNLSKEVFSECPPSSLRKSSEPNREATSHSQQEHFVDLFWAGQKHQAVFVIPADQFAWHWNLFKKLMRADHRLKFAYIGPKTLKTSRGQLLDSNPTNSYAYIKRQFQYENWMARRIAVLHSSGLLDFWNKWHYIMRNLDKEINAAELEEQRNEFKPLAVADPSLKLLFSAVYITLLSLVIVLLLEIFVSMFHLAQIEI